MRNWDARGHQVGLVLPPRDHHGPGQTARRLFPCRQPTAHLGGLAPFRGAIFVAVTTREVVLLGGAHQAVVTVCPAADAQLDGDHPAAEDVDGVSA